MARRPGRATSRGGEGGFSLVELMIAMTATLIITGAVFQLMSAGQTAFRKEPALSDRQQSIRMALDIIAQDLYRAGYGLPEFAQAFTDGLDGVGAMGSLGGATDELQIFAASECPTVSICDKNDMGSGASLTTFEILSDCYNFPSLVILGDETKWGLYWAEKPGAGTTGSCAAGGSGAKNGHVTLPHGKAPLVNPPGGLGGWVPDYMLVGQAIRYRIQTDADGTPNLERSAFGGQTMPDGSSSWQPIARGVEDLQVEYLNAAGWLDEPGVIVAGAHDTLVRRVRVRLSARVVGEANLTGQRTSAVGNAVRGELATEVAPRTAAATLGMFEGEL